MKRYKILGTYINFSDYDEIIETIQSRLYKKENYLITPLASHTLVRAYFNADLRNVLNAYDGLFPDSQWVKRSLYFLYGAYLKERAYGPELMQRICKLSQEKKYNIFLYGTTKETLEKLKNSLTEKYPGLTISGSQPSKFGSLNLDEKKTLINTIEHAKTNILLVSLGSPLEQLFAYDLLYRKPVLKRRMLVMTVGAAFDFISHVKPQAPEFMQQTGFEWLFRLVNEPFRLWYRYVVLGSVFVVLIVFQKIAAGLGFGPR